MLRNTADGHTEALCLYCANSKNSAVQKDNWTVQQIRNCAVSMTAKTKPADKFLDYVSSTDKSVQVNGWAEFFTNNYPTDCGGVKTCEIMNDGCLTAYSGNKLTMVAATGVINAVQNEDAGWTETICYRCVNKNDHVFTSDTFKIS